MILQIPLILNVPFMMLSELSTLLLTTLIGMSLVNNKYTPAVHPVVFNALDLQWCVLLLFVQWVLLDHLGLMLMDDEDCAPPILLCSLQLCTTFLSPDTLFRFLVCWLIALDK